MNNDHCGYVEDKSMANNMSVGACPTLLIEAILMFYHQVRDSAGVEKILFPINFYCHSQYRLQSPKEDADREMLS